MAPQTRKNANNNSSDNAEGSGANLEFSGIGLEALMAKFVTVQAQIQEHPQWKKTEQATRHTQMMNALAGHWQNNNEVQDEDAADDNSNWDNELNQNEVPLVGQVARAHEALIKHYNQCKPKEFKGTGGATEVEDWIRATERIFKAMNCIDAQ